MRAIMRGSTHDDRSLDLRPTNMTGLSRSPVRIELQGKNSGFAKTIDIISKTGTPKTDGLLKQRFHQVDEVLQAPKTDPPTHPIRPNTCSE